VIRLTYMIRRRADLSIEAFQNYWLNTHGPLVASHGPAMGIRRYVQTHVRHDDPLTELLRTTYGTSSDLFDGAADLWFTDRQELEDRLNSPAGKNAAQELLVDEGHFIDASRSALWFGVESPQINFDEDVIAHEASSVMKWVAPLWKLPGLTVEETLSHWLMNHGPLVRQGARTVPMLRYLQIHAFDDPLADQLRAERGTMNAPIYGHAELWVDRHALGTAAGPEVDKAFELFVADCRQFIDLPRSPFQMGKEFVLIDLPAVPEPIPVPRRSLW
jgi:EthD domain